MPQEEHPRYQPMIEELRRMFEAHQRGGWVEMEYTTRMYYAQIA